MSHGVDPDPAPNPAPADAVGFDLRRFYELLDRLALKTGGPRILGTADGRMVWPRRGVYFFIDAPEVRSGSGTGHRVVRVGTHGLKPKSGSTLWGRLAQHRGSAAAGNHRGSIFRLLVGLAIAGRDPSVAVPSWGQGASAPSEVTERERELEARVSAVIGKMQVLWLAIEDEPGPTSLRGFVERNSIALLSAYRTPAIDPASPGWLGHHCPRDRVRNSGLWNSNHVDESLVTTFLSIFEELIETGTAAPARVVRQRDVSIAEPRIRAGGNTDLIIEALQRWPDLDDDELSRRSGVVPRQQVNIICRRLEQRGILTRFTGTYGKIVNRLAGALRSKHSRTEVRTPRLTTQPIVERRTASSLSLELTVRPVSAAEDTLVVIPCSGRKKEGSEQSDERGTLLDELPDDLARRLVSARTAIADVALLDESTIMPAWRRYSGMLYQSGHLTLMAAKGANWFRRLLILSGGYGVVRAIDPIGTYDLALDEGRWPRGLLQELIEAYARKHRIQRVIALVSETTAYASILRKVDWRGAGVSEALILTPEASTGAMVKAPRAIGEALSAVIDHGLDASWRSSDGLPILVRSLI
jgi:hypothetical protein